MEKFNSKLRRQCRALARDERGAVLIVFAVFLVIAVALYIFVSDLARHNVARTRLQDATDTVALSIAGQYVRNPAGLDEDMQAYFEANFPQDYLGAKNISAEVNIVDDELIVTAEGGFDSWSRYFTAPLYARSVVNLGGGDGSDGGAEGGFWQAVDDLSEVQRYNYNIMLPSDDGTLHLFLGAFEDKSSPDSPYHNVFHWGNHLWWWSLNYDYDIAESISGGDDHHRHQYLHKDGLGIFAAHGIVRRIEGREKVVLTFKNSDCDKGGVRCPGPDNLKQVNFSIKDLTGNAQVAIFYDNDRVDYVPQTFKENGRYSIKSPDSRNISRLVFSADVDKPGSAFLLGPDITIGGGGAGEIYLAG